MSEWSKLPNAKHIDWVLQTLKDNADTWITAWDSAKSAKWDAVWNTASYAAGDPAKDAALNAAMDAVWNTASYAARDAILAFIAYDNCEKYLNMSYDQLLMWSELDPHPAVLLLLPYLYVKELTKEVDLV